MTAFKICSLRDAPNALIAAEAGASYLGFNFVHGVRRQVTPDQASEVIGQYRSERGDGGPALVGLFADQPIEEVNRIVRRCGLQYAQLCGGEPPPYWDDVDASVIKVIRVREDLGKQEAASRAMASAEKVVAGRHIPHLDKYEPGRLGGLGRTFDWSIAARVAARYDVVLAGGLTPENVGEAIAAVRPRMVDVSSGVETNGDKDPNKIRAFAHAVSAANAD